MINKIKADAEQRMEKSVESLQNEFSKIRTGRAHPGLLEHVMVDYYGNNTPLNQVASIAIGDSRTLLVTPWEKNIVSDVEKAIMNADLGLNPVTVGQAIRVPLPQLSEERRKELIKVVRGEAEKAKVAIRNIRRDANTQLKDFLKNKEISEDDERRGQDNIQKLTDGFIEGIDKQLTAKEADLLEI